MKLKEGQHQGHFSCFEVNIIPSKAVSTISIGSISSALRFKDDILRETVWCLWLTHYLYIAFGMDEERYYYARSLFWHFSIETSKIWQFPIWVAIGRFFEFFWPFCKNLHSYSHKFLNIFPTSILIKTSDLSNQIPGV